MEPIASFSGLASGIDFRSLVDEIIQIESRPIRRAEEQIQEANDRASAWESFRGKISTLNDAAEALSDGTAFGQFTTSVSSLSATGIQPVSATAGSEASPGSYSVKVHQLAANEKVGSDVFSSRTEALGISGEFLVNGVAVTMESTDTLNDLVSTLNAANRGADASGVTASVLVRGDDAYSIVLTSDEAGDEGVALLDGADGTLRSLGFVDDSTQLRHQTSDGALGDWMSSDTVAVATTLGLASPPTADTVTMGGVAVTLDLATMSLQDVASAINTAAAGAGSSVTAQVVSETGDDGDTSYRLGISGTTSFTDANGILETLGVLERGRSSVAQEVTLGSQLTAGDATTPATGSTLLSDLWVSGSSAGVQVGDTLDFTGTRGDGSTFTKSYTVGAGDTLDDVLASLNSATDGFQAGSRTATAALSDGRLTVTDDETGTSRLALSVVSNNEGGGRLDFGAMSVTETGRERELVAGRDSQFEVDGTFLTRDGNVVTDAIPGVTLRLQEASEYSATVDVSLNANKVTEAVQALVDGYNDLAAWVADQFSGAGAEEGVEDRPLSGDRILRQMRNNLRNAMQTQLDASVGGLLARSTDIGVEINREGQFDFDSSKLLDALESDPVGVQTLFEATGSTSTSSLTYLTAGDEVDSGTYDVEVTQAATRGGVTGSGFGGSYADDGTADTMTITDLATGSEYSVALANGMTLSEIISALNTEFATEKTHQVQASETMYADAVGTVATDSTLLQDLHASDGTSFGVADGDTITLSGTNASGVSFLQEFSVTDVTTQTLGDLRAAVESAVGSTEDVTWDGGRLTSTNQEAGRSSLTLNVSSDNAGGGSLDFGTMDVITEGRYATEIQATDAGGELSIQHDDYGSAAGLEVSFTPGGTDGSASLGVAADTYAGIDVAGTIGGHAASGSGRVLTGGDDTAVEGLMIRYEGVDTGSIGNVTFSRGIASSLEVATDFLLSSEDGSIDDIIEGIDPLVDRLNDRIDALEGRLERRREALIREFSALEAALAQAQQQSQWLAAQFGSLPSAGAMEGQ